jgi:hypothetical protein
MKTIENIKKKLTDWNEVRKWNKQLKKVNRLKRLNNDDYRKNQKLLKILDLTLNSSSKLVAKINNNIRLFYQLKGKKIIGFSKNTLALIGFLAALNVVDKNFDFFPPAKPAIERSYFPEVEDVTLKRFLETNPKLKRIENNENQKYIKALEKLVDDQTRVLLKLKSLSLRRNGFFSPKAVLLSESKKNLKHLERINSQLLNTLQLNQNKIFQYEAKIAKLNSKITKNQQINEKLFDTSIDNNFKNQNKLENKKTVWKIKNRKKKSEEMKKLLKNIQQSKSTK